MTFGQTAMVPITRTTPASATVTDLIRSEWTKIRSLRSTVWSLALLVMLNLAFTALFVGITVAQWTELDAATRATVVADPTRLILATGLNLSQLAVCVLGVMVITNEFASGTIHASFLAVPRRSPMLMAKTAVFALLVFVVGEIAAFPSFLIGAALTHSKASVSLGDPGVLRAVIGAGLYLAVLGMFAIAIGTLIRHTAGAITGIIAFVLVVAPLAQLIPGSLGKHVHAYLPSEAGGLIVSPHQAATDLLTPWQGFGVFCLWTAALLILALLSIRRRDA